MKFAEIRAKSFQKTKLRPCSDLRPESESNLGGRGWGEDTEIYGMKETRSKSGLKATEGFKDNMGSHIDAHRIPEGNWR